MLKSGMKKRSFIQKMDNYFNCIAHPTSCGNLLVGRDATAIFDCGMLFCARETVEKIKSHLDGRPLDYLFATHSHYDHIGALPALRAEWPSLRLVTCEIGAAILLKDTPRRVIRELSLMAVEKYTPGTAQPDYSDDDLHADIIVQEGDAISLGGLTVEAVATPGHTKDSLSYFVRELGLLILSETTGVRRGDGRIVPAYLTSYTDTVRAIEKCRAIPYKYISPPHTEPLSPGEADGFFDRAMRTVEDCRDFILDLRRGGADEERILESYADRYSDKAMMDMQPRKAFLINARATVACTLREFGESE